MKNVKKWGYMATKVTNIFNQNDPIGTRWVYTRACPFEIYERREGMFKFIGYERHDEVTGKPRWMIRKPHKKDFYMVQEPVMMGDS